MFARTLTWAGLALGPGVGVAGCLFAAGYAFTDRPLGLAMGVTALWILPTVVLIVDALRRPKPAARALLLAAVGITVFAVVDAFSGLIPSDDWGPVATVMDLAPVIALSFLAVRRPGPAGMPLTGVAMPMSVETSERPISAELGRLDSPASNGRRRVTR